MKIGIMGGTFDPIHNGHFMLGRYARDLFELDQIWFMPNGTPPHKNSDAIKSQTAHRVEMVKRAIANENKFVLQTYEVERKEVNYSYLTMEHFCQIYPNDEFYFIIGADSLFAIEKWKCPERLLKTCTVLAAYRDGKQSWEMAERIAYLNEKYGADIRLLNTPNVDISSTDIRALLKEHVNVSDILPDSVYEYILENNLFGDE
jgi:nicotinate-nucleotide adenylyltransferase